MCNHCDCERTEGIDYVMRCYRRDMHRDAISLTGFVDPHVVKLRSIIVDYHVNERQWTLLLSISI